MRGYQQIVFEIGYMDCADPWWESVETMAWNVRASKGGSHFLRWRDSVQPPYRSPEFQSFILLRYVCNPKSLAAIGFMDGDSFVHGYWDRMSDAATGGDGVWFV